MALIFLAFLVSCCSAGWMSKLRPKIGDSTLQYISLPGTHDSGAYNLTTEIAPDQVSPLLDFIIEFAEEHGIPVEDIITPWALAQDQTIYYQLKGGIRYLDLRACWDANTSSWRTFHFEMGDPIQLILNDIAKFLTEETEEIVVVEVSHFSGNPTSQDLSNLTGMIEGILGTWLYPRTNGFANTVNEMINSNQRAIVTVENNQAIQNIPTLWPGSTIINSYADSDNLTYMENYNEQQVKMFNQQYPYGTNQLYKISWTLTPQPKTIADMFVPGHPKSLIELADTAAPALDPFYQNQTVTNGYKLLANIVIIDHYESSNIIKLIVPY